LNRKYKSIRVSVKDLKIKNGKKRSSAVFYQTYVSDRYRATGKKELLFKRENGQWKIYRETWKKK
jgi:hypothetical protein